VLGAYAPAWHRQNGRKFRRLLEAVVVNVPRRSAGHVRHHAGVAGTQCPTANAQVAGVPTLFARTRAREARDRKR